MREWYFGVHVILGDYKRESGSREGGTMRENLIKGGREETRANGEASQSSAGRLAVSRDVYGTRRSECCSMVVGVNLFVGENENRGEIRTSHTIQPIDGG